ncbi:substrate-binding periplasmic protein [Kiloniella sp. b19]|uniref:substrate-binding periplasmic protein n=1 Tax=Kiloniella sp. GXU_MW_B19 TaxID=3141326 RepID=UPI0031D010EA
MFLFVLALLPAIFSSGTGKAGSQTLTVVSFDIPGVIGTDPNGLYNQVLAQITEETGVEFELVIRPISRARKEYASGRFDCLLPLDPVFEGQHLDHLQSIPFQRARIHIFTPTGEPALRSAADLRGLRVGGQLGLPYPPEIDRAIGEDKVSDLHTLMQMLKTDRFDAIVAFTPDIYQAFKHHDVEPFSHDRENPVGIYRDSLTCQPTGRNRTLMQQVNDALTGMGRN